jgi:hypothetical protein
MFHARDGQVVLSDRRDGGGDDRDDRPRRNEHRPSVDPRFAGRDWDERRDRDDDYYKR